MKKKAKAVAIAAITAAALACGMCAAAPAMAKVKAPEAPYASASCWNKYFTAKISWIKIKNADKFQARYAEKESDLKKAGAINLNVIELDCEEHTLQEATVSGLNPETEYFFQVRAGKTYTAKTKVKKRAYKKAKASGKTVTTKKIKQYKVKKASGKWSKWRKTKPYYKSSKRYKTRTVMRYFVKSKKTAWSAWGEPWSSNTKELPEANVTKNGKAQSELVVPKGSAAVSYVGLSKPWTDSDTKATVLRLDEGGELWQPADEVRTDGTYDGDYDTGEYCFQGWYLDEALTKPCDDATTALEAAEDSKVTLYAKWTEHNYQQRRIYRWTDFSCGWIKALLPGSDIEGQKGCFANGYYNNPDNYYKMTPALASLGKGACELVWVGNWHDATDGGVTFDGEAADHYHTGLKYNTETCTWEKVSIAKGTYYYDLYGRTNNLACWFPMMYEVCSDCNRVGDRITPLPGGTSITRAWALGSKYDEQTGHMTYTDCLAGNVATGTCAVAHETVSSPKGSYTPYGCEDYKY